MARPRKTQAAPAAELELAGADLLEGADQLTAAERLGVFFGQAGDGGDVRVVVYELGDDVVRDRSFLFAFALAEAPEPDDLLGQILSQYGPGLYELIARDHSDGKIAFRQRFAVGSSRDRSKPRFELGPRAAPAPAAAVPGGEFAAVMAQQNRILETMAAAIAARPPERDTLSIARELAQLRELFAPATPAPTQNLREVVKDLLSVLSLRDQLTGGGADENPLTAAVRTLGPVLTRAVERFAPEGGAPAPGAPTPPVAQSGPTAAPAPAAPSPVAPQDGTLAMLQSVLVPVLELAEAGVGPADAAEQLLAALAQQPEWVEQAVLTYLDELGADASDKLVSVEPRLARHRDWVQQTLAAIGAALEDSDAQPPSPPSPAPAGANGAPHGGADGSASRA